MKRLTLGIFIGIFLPFLAGYLAILSGRIPVATKGEPLPFEHFIAKKVIQAAYKSDLSKGAPFTLTEDHLDSGARIYRNNCGGCHGVEDHDNLMAKAMFPPAPQLFQQDKNVTDDPVGEIYWKIKNGIRLTGMPGYTDILKESEIWEVSLFLKNANQLPDSAIKLLKGEKQ